jgi:hypothetical protein
LLAVSVAKAAGVSSRQQAQLLLLPLVAAQVHVVELTMSREEAVRRHEAAAAASALGLEVADLGAEASRGLLEEASFMPEQQQLLLQPDEQVSLKLLCLGQLRNICVCCTW